MSLIDDVLSELAEQNVSALEALDRNLAKLRTGRANAALLDDVRVDYYGTLTPLSQCAQIIVPEPRMLTVKPWEKAIIPAIEKAIRKAALGLNPQSDGDMVRVPVPQLTEERRKDLVKQARGRGEEAKIAIRNHRRDANDMLKEAEKEKEISQDDLKRALEKVQNATDTQVTRVDETLVKKEADIMEI